MTATARRGRSTAPLVRLLALLAQEAPLEQFQAVLADAVLPGDEEGAQEVAEAVRSAITVRSLLVARRRREQELSALYETAGDLSSLRDLEAVLQAIVHRARQLLDTDAAYLMLHDESRQVTSMRVTDGVRTEAFKRIALELGSGLGGMVAVTGTPYATDDYTQDARLEHRIDAVVAGEGLVAILGVPLRRGTRVIGVLFGANRARRPFSHDEVALLTSLADHAAIAIENAALFQEAQAALDELRQASELVRRHSEVVERGVAMHERLNGVVLGGGGLPEVARAVVDVLGGDLVVLDALGRPVVEVGEAPRTAAVVAALAAGAGGQPGAVAEPAERRTVQREAPAGTPVTLAPVLAGAERLGLLVLAGRRLEDAEVGLLERAAVVTALLLVQARSIAEAEQRVRGELIHDLIASPQRDPDALHRRAEHLGLDLRTPYVVVVARPTDPAGCESAVRAGTLPGQPRPELYAQHEGDLVLLVAGDDPAGTARRLAAQLSAAGRCAFTVGAAGPGSGTAAVPELFRDATGCVDVLLALDREGGAASADDLGVYGLVLAGADRADVRRFVQRTVGRVLDHDRERGSELARTLLAFYGQGGNLTRTAAELYVHVNTLYQRLERVGQLLGEDWRTGDRALQVHLALKVHLALGGPAA